MKREFMSRLFLFAVMFVSIGIVSSNIVNAYNPISITDEGWRFVCSLPTDHPERYLYQFYIIHQSCVDEGLNTNCEVGKKEWKWTGQYIQKDWTVPLYIGDIIGCEVSLPPTTYTGKLIIGSVEITADASMGAKSLVSTASLKGSSVISTPSTTVVQAVNNSPQVVSNISTQTTSSENIIRVKSRPIRNKVLIKKPFICKDVITSSYGVHHKQTVCTRR